MVIPQNVQEERKLNERKCSSVNTELQEKTVFRKALMHSAQALTLISSNFPV